MTGLQQRRMQSHLKDEHRRKSEKLKQGGRELSMIFGMGDDIGSALENAGVGYLSKDPVFLYSGVLVAALLPPFLVMLAFGGKPTMLVLSIGGLAAHIFDIVGSVEATVFALVIMFICMWITLVYSARHILQASMWNFHLLTIMGVLLICAFLLCTAAFRSARREFDTGFRLFEILAFATLPLFGSAFTHLVHLCRGTGTSSTCRIYVDLLCVCICARLAAYQQRCCLQSGQVWHSA